MSVGRENVIKIFDNLFVHFRGVPKPAHAPLSVGLWRECRTFSWRYGINECSAITLTCSGVANWFLGQCLKLMIARTFIIIACIFSGFGAILLVLIGIRGEGNPRLIILGKVIVIVSLICSIIGFAVGISWILYGGWQLGAAAILAIVAAALNLLIAVFVLLILTSKSTSTTQM